MMFKNELTIAIYELCVELLYHHLTPNIYSTQIQALFSNETSCNILAQMHT